MPLLAELFLQFALLFCVAFGGATLADPHAPWRYTLMSGVLPAIPLILIRPLLPESPAWLQKKAAGTLKRPSVLALFSTPQLRRTTIITSILFACSYGAAFGAIQHIPRIVPGLEEVKDRVQKGTADLEGKEKADMIRNIEGKAASEYVKVQELGGLTGRFLFALIVIYFISQRQLLRDVSHELRSPLARLRIAIDLLPEKTDDARRAEIVRSLSELDTLVEEILLASRLDHVKELESREAVDLLAIAAYTASLAP